MNKLLFIFAFFIIHNSFSQISDFKNIDFTKADNIAKLNEGMSLSNLPVLANNLTSQLGTNVEKFRAIYIWVCQNITVDTRQGDKVQNQRHKFKDDSLSYLKWNNKYKTKAFKKLIKYKKTMCTGYAYIIKELCFLADIDCVIINGYARTADTNIEKLELTNHSWNAVKLDNKWYLCDAIWASGYTDANKNYRFIKDYNNGYFLTDPILFSKNHYPLNKKWLLNDSLITAPFIATPIVYGETFRHQIIPMSPKQMAVKVAKNERLEFSFKSLETINTKTISLVYFIGADEFSFPIEDFNTVNHVTSFTSKFKTKGFYDVHLKVDNAIVMTYTINVTK